VESVFDEFLDHLEYLGYNIEEDYDGSIFLAKHECFPNFIIKYKAAGILFYTLAKCNELVDIDRPGFIERLNELNSRSMVLRFWVDEDNDLIMDAWCSKHYDRAGFAIFMDLLIGDMRLLFSEDYGVEEYCE
jgi:hypothetical protein